MLHTIERAVDYYQHKKDIWLKLQERGMQGDYSWNHSAREYIKLYESMFKEKKDDQKEHSQEPNPVVVDIP